MARIPTKMSRRGDDRLEPEPADRSTLSESVANKLRDRILQGELVPGTRLRPQHLVESLGVSVMPVREALRILGAEGLVSSTPRMGARVTEFSNEDIEELYLERGALEGLAARLAVINMTDEELLCLAEAFNEMLQAQARQDLPGFMTWDREFHRRHYSASGRPRLVQHISELWSAGRLILPLTVRTEDPMTPALAAHRAVLDACERRDPTAAERLTRIHTEQAAERILAGRRGLRRRPATRKQSDGEASASQEG
jgi:DNA-binding GntR family transcriptional regulator